MYKTLSVLRNCPFACPVRKKYVVVTVLFLFILDYFGVFTHIFEIDIRRNFRYPYDGDVSEFVLRIRQGLKPGLEPINIYNYSYITTCPNKCNTGSDKLKLVYIVKSSIENFERRKAIRHTWGFENRFSDVAIRTLFVLGVTENKPEIQAAVKQEHEKFKDIIQINFIDTYYNNTIKTMCSFKWITEFCPNSHFYYFSDDDMYISTKNVLLFLRNPTNYPEYLQLPENVDKNVKDDNKNKNMILNEKKSKHIFDMELAPDVILFAGHVFVSSPHRHKSSKWFVSLREYPYDYWPPYISAGAYVLSKEALNKMYYTSYYTKHFRFDDIFLGLVALKAGIEPFHCSEFNFYKKEYTPYNYKYVISSHGYGDTNELTQVWNEQKSRGYA